MIIKRLLSDKNQIGLIDGTAASNTNIANNNKRTNGPGYITNPLSKKKVQDILSGFYK